MKHACAYSHFWQTLHPRTSTRFATQGWPARLPDLSPLTAFGDGKGRISYTDMRHLTTGIRSEKCVVRRLRRCANATECTYTNLDSTV